ncbi:DUF2800 domain-containing protein, partial [uncultured Amphritea sp.]|uniref:DUF2800 domain-containing protein n=1 Tax=uncultured Amphritea sp. TaxID=981605 RepID=UPI002601E4A8
DADHISMGRLLNYLFEVTERFGMETRTELILLQRTMVVVEGVARSLDPRINIWEVAQPVVEDYIKELRVHAHLEAERGVKIPGYKLVPKRASRQYNDKEAAEAALRKMSGVKVADIMNHTLKTPAQIEKSIPKKKYETFAEAHVSMVSSGTTLARDTDNRPDVSDPLSQLARHVAD